MKGRIFEENNLDRLVMGDTANVNSGFCERAKRWYQVVRAEYDFPFRHPGGKVAIP